MEHTATFERYQKRASRLLELRQKYGLPGDALSKYIGAFKNLRGSHSHLSQKSLYT